MKLKVLVLGSTGLIGHQVYNYLNSLSEYHMYDISYRTKLNQNTIICDIRNTKKFIKIIEKISPNIIINCIGVLIEGANSDEENAIYINSFMPHRLSRLAKRINSRFIHMSTDCVFSGKTKTPYKETDFKDGIGIYAKTKGLGEIIDDTHLTLRTSVIGPELKKNGEELFHWFMSQSTKVEGYKGSIWSGVTTIVLAKVVNWAIKNKITGLYHVTNNSSIDKYSLLMLIKKYTKKKIVINPVVGKELNKSFVDTRNELDFIIPNYDSMVKSMVNLIKNNSKFYSQYNLSSENQTT